MPRTRTSLVTHHEVLQSKPPCLGGWGVGGGQGLGLGFRVLGFRVWGLGLTWDAKTAQRLHTQQLSCFCLPPFSSARGVSEAATTAAKMGAASSQSLGRK